MDENENKEKRPLERVTAVDVVVHLDVNPAAGVATTNDYPPILLLFIYLCLSKFRVSSMYRDAINAY